MCIGGSTLSEASEQNAQCVVKPAPGALPAPPADCGVEVQMSSCGEATPDFALASNGHPAFSRIAHNASDAAKILLCLVNAIARLYHEVRVAYATSPTEGNKHYSPLMARLLGTHLQ